MAKKNGQPATTIWRRQQPVVYAAGTKTMIPVTRGLCFRYMALHLTATPTITGANNTVANTGLGDEWACVSKIELIANGTTVLFSAAGSDLKQLQKILLGQRPRVQPNLGDGATANPVLDSTVIIPFLNPKSRRPFDTLLYTGEMSDLRLEVTFTADATAINSAATGWTAQPVIEVFTREQTIPLDPTTGAPMLPNFYRRMLKIPFQISGANPAARYQLNTGPIYRGAILNVLSGALAESATILTNVKTFSGPTVFSDMTYNSLEAVGKELTNTPDDQAPLSTGIWIQSAGEVSSKRVVQSWAFSDFCEDGYMSEALDTDSIGDTFFEFNVNAAATINIFTQELLRINRGGASAPANPS